MKESYNCCVMPFGALSIEQSVSVAGQGLTTIQVDGFQEAYEAGTESVEIDNQPFQVCTLAGIVLLKFIVYDDRPEHRLKDILDIGAILRHYFDIVEDDIYENHNDLFSDDEFDITLTAARVMGRQMAPILALSSALRQRIDQIIDCQINMDEQSPRRRTASAGQPLVDQLRAESAAAIAEGIRGLMLY